MDESNLKTEIIKKLSIWKEEHEPIQDAFSHTAGKNKELALIGDKVIDLILYKTLYNIKKTVEFSIGKDTLNFSYRPIKKGKMDSMRQKYFCRAKHVEIFDRLELKNLLIG